ncbi:MAG: DJ-1/PfpI family protein [Candidatus Margulisbacteria bacterium]|nr:DJ-1/PfpI family protein [Candidatus Margulisiibacteriota bacterium]
MDKNALMVIAFERFRDEEYAEPKKVLEKAGFKVTTASLQTGIAKGKYGMEVPVDIALKNVKAADYDTVIFVGGPGSHGYFDDPTAQAIAQETHAAGKILAAICAAPSILANAGLLKGKTATSFADQGPNLTAKGAHFTGRGLEIDSNIITADGPAHAKEFGEAIVKGVSWVGGWNQENNGKQ